MHYFMDYVQWNEAKALGEHGVKPLGQTLLDLSKQTNLVSPLKIVAN